MAVKEIPAREDLSEGLVGLKLTPGAKPSRASLATVNYWTSLKDGEEMKEAMRKDLIEVIVGDADGQLRSKEQEGKGAGDDSWDDEDNLPGPSVSMCLLLSHTWRIT